MNTFLVLAVCLAVVAADKIGFYKDCGSKSGSITSISVEGCTSSPCPLPRGKSTPIEVDFVSNVNSATLTAVVFGQLPIGTLPWNGVPKDACLGTSCPLVSGQSYAYKVGINVLADYPPIPATVKYALKDASGTDVVCFLLPVKLV